MESQSKKQYVYQVLRSRVLDGIYTSGFRIVIDRIAKELNVSTIPVREAIRHLEADGLIEYEPYKGAVVTPIDNNQYLEALSTLAIIEGYAIGLSSSQFPDQQIPRLIKINEDMKEAMKEFDFILFGDLNRKFHGLIYEYCDNRYLVNTIKHTQAYIDTIRRIGSAFKPVRPRQSVAEHDELIEMIRKRKPPKEVEDLARKHKLNTVESFRHDMRFD